MSALFDGLRAWGALAQQGSAGFGELAGPGAPLPEVSAGYGASLARSLLALVAVSALAWWSLRAAARRGVAGAGSRVVRVLERTPLDAKHAVFLVRAGDKVLLLGASEGAALTVLSELPEHSVRALEQGAAQTAAGKPGVRSFREALAAVRGGALASATASATTSANARASASASASANASASATRERAGEGEA